MIAKEGLIFIGIGVILTAGFLFTSVRYDNKILFSFAVLTGVLTIFTTFFFRDPDRTFEHHEGILVSPADGKVLAIEEIKHHDFIGGPALKVSIFLSVFDVHVNRVPADGIIDYVNYNPGKFFAAWRDKASKLNEQTEIGMTTPSGQKIVFIQIAGMIARRIVCKLEQGDTAVAGERFGMIRFGSRTELIVPADTKIDIKAGEHVAGGETVIGLLSGITIPVQVEVERQ